MAKRKPIQFKETAFEKLVKLAGIQQQKTGKPVTPAEYVRNIVDKHIRRKGL